MTKLKHLRHALFDWSSAGTSNYARQLLDLETTLRQSLVAPVVDWQEVHRLEGERAHAQIREERYSRQQGRNNWLKGGDRNTIYFHRLVSVSWKRKRIDVLETEDWGGGGAAGRRLEGPTCGLLLSDTVFHGTRCSGRGFVPFESYSIAFGLHEFCTPR
ncbi:hypothetical protein LINGRAHAP2_LOCUS32189 [Linum grandiflorum]